MPRKTPLEKMFLGSEEDPPQHQLKKKVDWVAFGEAFEDLTDDLIGAYEMCARAGFSYEFWRQHRDELITTYWSKLQTGELQWEITDKKQSRKRRRKKSG